MRFLYVLRTPLGRSQPNPTVDRAALASVPEEDYLVDKGELTANTSTLRF